MGLIITTKGSKYIVDMGYNVNRPKGIAWVDWFVLTSLDEINLESIEYLVEEGPKFNNTISGEDVKTSIRGLFEAGYIEQGE